MSLAEDSFRKLDKYKPTVRQSMQTIQDTTISDMSYTAVWAAGCLSKIIGIIDSTDDVERLLQVAKSETLTWDNMVAMTKASYTYDNLLSLTHDLLDNIGYIYGVKVIGCSPQDRAKSFHKIFNRNFGRLCTPSSDVILNERLENLYTVAKSFTDQDNNNKHKFSPGLIDLHQSESVIRALPENLSGNLVLFLDMGAVPVDLAASNVVMIRENVLPEAVEIVVHLLQL